ncbi:MAG: VWA domain-containing protein [Ruminococcus sp.]|nr:VWA domain-containing protein [Ruminococcus sp.]
MMNLVRGYRGRLADILDDAQPFRVVMHTEGKAVYDSCCFGVDAAGKLTDDRYMVFYNQTASPGNAVCLKKNGRDSEYIIELDALPPQIERLVFTVSIDGSGTMGEVVSHIVSLEQEGSLGAGITLSGKDFEHERAIIDIEIYRKNGWRFSAVARGFDGGLTELLKSYGGDPIENNTPPPAPKALRPAPSAVPSKEQRPAQPKVVPTSKKAPKPKAVPTPNAIPTSNTVPTQKAVPTPNAMPTPNVMPTPNAMPTQKAVPTPNAMPKPNAVPTPNAIPKPRAVHTPPPPPVPPKKVEPNVSVPSFEPVKLNPVNLPPVQAAPNPQYGGQTNPPPTPQAAPNPQYGGQTNPPPTPQAAPNPQYGGQTNPPPRTQTPPRFSPNKPPAPEYFGNATPEQLLFAQNGRAPSPNPASQFGRQGNPPPPPPLQPQYGGTQNPPPLQPQFSGSGNSKSSPQPQFGGTGNPPPLQPQFGGQRTAAPAFADDTQIADKLMKKINLSKDKVNLEKHVVNLSKCVVDLSKKSGVDLGNTRAKVVVALDFSGSMSRLYSNGTVQDTINRLVPLGLTFDDNGSIDMFLFQTDYRKMPDLDLSNYDDYVQSVIRMSGYTMGGTNYFPVLQAIIEGSYKSKGWFRGKQWVPPIVDRGDPTFILFITDGENSDQSLTNSIIRKSSEMNVFIQFIGIGDTTFRYLEQLDDMEGRQRDNTGFSKMADLAAADDNELYTNVLEQFSKWLRGLQ